jgi:hypothetical protein
LLELLHQSVEGDGYVPQFGDIVSYFHRDYITGCSFFHGHGNIEKSVKNLTEDYQPGANNDKDQGDYNNMRKVQSDVTLIDDE